MTSLVLYEAARAALAAVHSVDEVKDIRDKAQAMAAYARQAKDTALVEWATEIKVRAERRAGELLRDMEKHPGGNPNLSHDTTGLPPTLETLGISRDQSSRWQKLAAVDAERFELAVAAAKEVAGEVTTAALLRLNSPHVAHNAGDNEWYTPAEIVEAARTTMGGIDCDPASSALANRTVQATHFFTSEIGGLEQHWGKRIWMNPPYAQPLIVDFCAALTAKYASGEVVQACALVNNATETAWFQGLLASASCVAFPQSRIRFEKPDGARGAPLQGQAILYFGERCANFLAAFGGFGYVARLTP